jgi:hypothetical protein
MDIRIHKHSLEGIMRIYIAVLCLSISSALTACGGGGTSTYTNDAPLQAPNVENEKPESRSTTIQPINCGESNEHCI